MRHFETIRVLGRTFFGLESVVFDSPEFEQQERKVLAAPGTGGAAGDFVRFSRPHGGPIGVGQVEQHRDFDGLPGRHEFHMENRIFFFIKVFAVVRQIEQETVRIAPAQSADQGVENEVVVQHGVVVVVDDFSILFLLGIEEFRGFVEREPAE